MRYSLLLLVSLTGCQCLGISEAYMDGIDRVSDRDGAWDAVYSPAYDLTRIGRPDWCSYPVNRALCPCRCGQQGPTVCHDYPLMVSHVSASMPGPASQANQQEPPTEREPYSRSNLEVVAPPVPMPPNPELPSAPEPAPAVQQMNFNWAQPASEPEVIPATVEQPAEVAIPTPASQSAAVRAALQKNSRGRVVAPRPEGPARPVWARPQD